MQADIQRTTCNVGTCHIWHGKSAYLRWPKLQAYPPIFSLTPKASGSTRLQSCEDKVFNSLRRMKKTISYII